MAAMNDLKQQFLWWASIGGKGKTRIDCIPRLTTEGKPIDLCIQQVACLCLKIVCTYMSVCSLV